MFVTGITAPIQVKASESSIGLGKQEEYDRVIQEVTRERRKLDVEVEQTADFLEKKEATAQREQLIEDDLKSIHREFYCNICDKQYKNVSEVQYHCVKLLIVSLRECSIRWLLI